MLSLYLTYCCYTTYVLVFIVLIVWLCYVFVENIESQQLINASCPLTTI